MSDAASLLADLQSRIAALVAAARKQGHDEAMDEIRSLVGGGAMPVKRGPGRPPKSATPVAPAAAKHGTKRKNPWAGLSAEQKLARVNAIRKGRGLAPRTE